jgi:hypothetical protein
MTIIAAFASTTMNPYFLEIDEGSPDQDIHVAPGLVDLSPTLGIKTTRVYLGRFGSDGDASAEAVRHGFSLTRSRVVSSGD